MNVFNPSVREFPHCPAEMGSTLFPPEWPWMARMYSMFPLESEQYCNMFLVASLLQVIQSYLLRPSLPLRVFTMKHGQTAFPIQLLQRLLEDHLRVARFSCFFRNLWQLSSITLGTAGMSFDFRCLIGKVDDEDEDGKSCSLCSIATSFPVLDDASSQWIGFLFPSESSVTYLPALLLITIQD